ncbi:hypothetical protein SAMN05920897_101218 [Alkalispirochaeta americana]|uniref:Uncharacterized protein n=1 Tax=Alkalispirochaeta americana TaxID=159291 RepID=A0A1N6NEM8_9SPIO|nr:hypothetical protein SAMN05920897_101218 [Alkalispirochaeta americana]
MNQFRDLPVHRLGLLSHPGELLHDLASVFVMGREELYLAGNFLKLLREVLKGSLVFIKIRLSLHGHLCHVFGIIVNCSKVMTQPLAEGDEPLRAGIDRLDISTGALQFAVDSLVGVLCPYAIAGGGIHGFLHLRYDR